MGLFKRTEAEKEEVQRYRSLRQAKHAIYMGECMEAIGKIPANSLCGLSFKVDEEVLNIHHGEFDETVPYNKIKGFRVEESQENKGQWIATLTYAGKKRVIREKQFVEYKRTGIYENAKKSNMAIAFETVVKGIMEA